MTQQPKDFFAAYEKANRSADTAGMGVFYAATFMFGGANGVQAVEREGFLKIIPRMKAHYRATGLLDTHLRSVQENSLDSKYLLANVTWRMTIQSLADSKYVDVSATYVLMRTQDDALSIVFQIDHHDLASLIKSANLN